MLNIISDTTRVVWPEWIQYYDELPDKNVETRHMLVGIDLAISQCQRANYTAIVSMRVYGFGDKLKVYVLPNSVNKRMTFPETIQIVKEIYTSFKINRLHPEFLVETNGFQQIYADAFSEIGCTVKGVKQITDKRSRLALVSHLIQSGIIVFPRQGAELLIAQLTGFGIEHHDDLCDVFTIAAIELLDMLKNDRNLDAYLDWCERNGGPWVNIWY